MEHIAQRDEALLEMVNQIGMKLMGAEIMVGLKKLDLPNADLARRSEWLRRPSSQFSGSFWATRLSAGQRLMISRELEPIQ